MKHKKSISGIVAISLLIIITVISVITFNNFYNNYQLKIIVKVEDESKDSNQISIETIIGDKLYFKNSNDKNITLEKIQIGENICNITKKEYGKGMHIVDLINCTKNITNPIQEVIVITDKTITEKKIYFKNINLTKNTNLIPEIPQIAYSSCKEILDNGASNGDGIYNISYDNNISNQFEVYCDMTRSGGGWTLVMFNQNNGAVLPLIQETTISELKKFKTGNLKLSDFFNGSKEIRWYIENNLVIHAKENGNIFDIDTYYPLTDAAVHGGSFSTSYKYDWDYDYIDSGFSNIHCTWSYSSGNTGWYECRNLVNYVAYGDCAPCSQPRLRLFANGRSGYYSWGNIYDNDYFSLFGMYEFRDVKPAFVTSANMNSSLWIK